MGERTRLRGFCVLLRNFLISAVLYTCLFGLFQVARNPAVRAKGKLGIPALLDKAGPAELIQTTKTSVKIKFAGSATTVTINPHANVFNRPVSAVQRKNDYLGKRPHVDTEADLHMLVEECRGTYAGIEKMRNVFDCMKFLADDEDRYYGLPEDSARASAQDPRQAEYNNADGHDNTLSTYPSYKSPDVESLGACSGPIIPFHTYWTGPATWRVEIFIKSYLFTQNLACSRLYIWLDSDQDPKAVDKMLNKDALFARFLPFVKRGDIALKAWKFPSRIPMPENMDHTDGIGYYSTEGKPNAKGEIAIADGLLRDRDGQQWLQLSPKLANVPSVAISDAMRFVVLHIYGGSYYDMDVLMMRDMRPLLLPKEHSFAERWAAHPHPGDYNTAVMSLTANSSLSSYLLRGGVRMGANFHPRVIGRMAWKDGRDQEFLMLETAAFDPIWTEFNWDREGRCTIPCLRDYGAVFKGREGAYKDEWESYDAEPLSRLNLTKPEVLEVRAPHGSAPTAQVVEAVKRESSREHSLAATEISRNETASSFSTTLDEEAELRSAGVVADYRLEEDKFPPNNRTLENFFRGAWTYHIHNQWLKHPEPSSWLAIVEEAHNGFFAGQITNPYGEKWEGPSLQPYHYWPEYV